MTLFEYMTDHGKYRPFSLPASEELTGRTARFPDGRELSFGGEPALKCDDELFLVSLGDRRLLVEERPDGDLEARDAEALTEGLSKLPEALEGWETDLCFASGYVLTALFRDGTLSLRPSPEPVSPGAEVPQSPQAEVPSVSFPLLAAETGDKRFLLRIPETGETVFLDGRRFLLYAIPEGRIAVGFVEAPARE